MNVARISRFRLALHAIALVISALLVAITPLLWPDFCSSSAAAFDVRGLDDPSARYAMPLLVMGIYHPFLFALLSLAAYKIGLTTKIERMVGRSPWDGRPNPPAVQFFFRFVVSPLLGTQALLAWLKLVKGC